MHLEHLSDPSPHLVLPTLIDPELYAQLSFPGIPEQAEGRIGRDLYVTDPGYEEVVQQVGWRDLRGRFTSEDFVQQVVGLFADDMRAQGCLVDPDRVHLDPYQETRTQTETNRLSDDHDPNALFTRFDLQAATATYGKTPHVDWPRRLVGGVLFLTSAEDEGMLGGDFGLYIDDDFQNDRVCHSPRLAASYPMRHNSGVLFLNCNTAFHGPTPITELTGLRKWVYYSISSRRDIWPSAPSRRRPRSRLAKLFR